MSIFAYLLILCLLFASSLRGEDATLDELVTEEEIDQLHKDEQSSASDPSNTGYLIVHRKFDTDGFAVGLKTTVNVRIFNVGGGSAYDVYAKDGWPLEHFNLTEGELTANFETIEA